VLLYGRDVIALWVQVSDRIWLVTFMDYDLGYFDDETCRLEPIENPFE
jgi:putative transposase